MIATDVQPGPVPILGLPSLDVSHRREMTMPEGCTVAEIVGAVLPGVEGDRLSMVRVTIGEWTIDRAHWDRVRPRAGLQVVVRIVLQGSGLRSILGAVVSIAALALGQFYVGPLLAGAFGLSSQIAGALGAALTGFAANFLLNALVPVDSRSNRKESPTYDVAGWQNARNPNGVVPSLVGEHRVAPQLAAADFTETIGDMRWTTAVVALYGPCEISDVRIGDTPITDLLPGEYSLEIREGRPGDAPLSLYPQQVIEDQVGVELMPYGGYGGDDPGHHPVTRTSPADAEELSIDFAFPGGLTDFSADGELERHTVNMKIEQRLAGSATWEVVEPDLAITGKQRSPMTRGFRWRPAVRGRYEVRVTRIDEADSSNNASEVSQWLALRAHRPEYPLNFDKPLTLVCAKVKATRLTNGRLDELNFLARRILPDWNGSAWVERATRNPASIYLNALRGPENGRPFLGSEINFEQLQDWHDFCRINDLTYDRVHDFDATFEEAVGDICRAGRATPHHDGTRWGVVIDRPRTIVKAHIGPRNAWNIQGSIVPVDPPDAFRCRFRDRTNDWEEAERVVPRPGFVGVPQRTEDLPVPGETDPAQIWITARRRYLEMEYRLESWTLQQDFEHLILARGDLARIALFGATVVSRVKAVNGRRVLLEDVVEMADEGDYAARFRAEDGSDVHWLLERREGTHATVLLAGRDDVPDEELPLPSVDDLAFVGRYGEETVEAIAKDVERGEDLTATLTLVPHAPEIDAFIATDEPPAWDGRVGGEVETDVGTPSAPEVLDVRSSGGEVEVTLQAQGPVRVSTFEVRARLSSGSGEEWDVTYSALSTSGRVVVSGYGADDDLEMQARAVGQTGNASAWTATFETTVQ